MGLLRLSKSESGKHKSVELTDEGRAALVAALPYWERAQVHLVTRFGDDRWNQIMRDLSAIVDATRSSAV